MWGNVVRDTGSIGRFFRRAVVDGHCGTRTDSKEGTPMVTKLHQFTTPVKIGKEHTNEKTTTATGGGGRSGKKVSDFFIGSLAQ